MAVPERQPGRSYEELVDEILARIPVHEPGWTIFSQSDPGVTWLELFAFLAEDLLGYDTQHGLTRPDGTSQTLDEARKRLEGRLEHLRTETDRIQCALERIKSIQRKKHETGNQPLPTD